MALKTTLTLHDMFSGRLKSINEDLKQTVNNMSRLDRASSTVKRIFGGFGLWASSATSKIKQPFEKLGQGIQNLRSKSRVIDGVINIFGSLSNRVRSSLKSTTSAILKFGSNLPQAFNRAKSAVNNFKNDFSNAFNKMKSSAEKSSSVFKSVLGATGVASLVGNAINQVQNLSGAAMQSSDSMDKFASTMQFAGIDNNQISEATKQLKAYADLTVYDNSDAFNTAAQLAANGISNYVDMTKAAGNLNAVAGGTKDTFKSLNLALVQTVGAGKLTTENWNQITDAIPGASGKLQQAMRDAGAFTGDFREAMADGEITANEFTDAILKLGNTQSALQAAQSTKTFEGAFGALESNVIDNINKVINALGKDKLVGVINSFSDLVSKGTDGLLNFASKTKPYLDIVKDSFNDVKAPIKEAVSAIVGDLKALNGGLGSQQSLSSFKNFMQGVTDGIRGVADFSREHSEDIAKLINILPKLAAAFIGFKIGKGVVGNVLSFSSGIFGMVGATGKLLGNLTGIFKFGKQKLPAPEMPSMPQMPSSQGGKGFDFASMFGGMAKYAKRSANIAIIFGIIKSISAAAQALKDVNSLIPDNLDGLALKFNAMILVISTMGALTGVAGQLANRNKVAAIAGFASIFGIALELALVGKAIKVVNSSVPSDIGSFASKIGNMAIAIGAFGALTSVLGALTSTGIGAVVGAAGFVSIVAISAEMIIVAKAISKLNASIPSDFNGLKGKLDTLTKVIGYFNSTNLGGAFKVVKNVISSANVATVSNIINNLIDVSKKLSQLGGITIPKGVDKKISQLQSVISDIKGSSLGSVLGSKFTEWKTDSIDATLQSLTSIAKKLAKIGTITVPSGIKGKISSITKAVSDLHDSSLGEAIASKFKQWDTGNIDSSLANLISISKKLKKIESITINADGVSSKIKSIKKAIEPLGGSFLESLKGIFKNGADIANFSAASKVINQLVNIANNLVSLQYVPFNEQGAITKIEAIKRVVGHLKGGTKGLGKAAADYGNAVRAIQKVIEVANTANQIVGINIDSNAIIANINKVKTIIAALKGISQGGGDGSGLVATVQAFQNLINVINQLNGTTQSVMSDFVSHIQTGMSQSVTTVTNGKTQMVAAFDGLSGQLQSAGNFAMQGLTSGINSGAGAAIAAAHRVANAISSTISHALKINSPSKLMKSFGGFVTEGLAIGMIGKTGQLVSAANTLASIPKNRLKKAPEEISASSTKIQHLRTSNNVNSSKTVNVNPNVTVNVDNSGGANLNEDKIANMIVSKIVETYNDRLD